ncbi:hypothetical protein DPMN_076833 [Dreissena polymorpha]|uniref:Uncharacterized protein n=1 Tax=Dreissena polymorpha TaxID=45954 RepID=A0A9D4BQU3_DREPO|nr:hypothetical protein DPMN_076833 [Dreissena polymorpha]
MVRHRTRASPTFSLATFTEIAFIHDETFVGTSASMLSSLLLIRSAHIRHL